MFGLTFEKLLLIGVIAAFIIGPERLPQAAEKLRQFVRWARDAAGGAKERLRDEMGDEFDDVDWKKLDPRQYDPRRIIREALLEDDDAQPGAAKSVVAATPTVGAATGVASGAEIGGPALASGLAGASVAGAAAASESESTTAEATTNADRPRTQATASSAAAKTIPIDMEAT